MKAKDILIVVASAAVCVLVVVALAVIWPMSSMTAAGQAIREQAELSKRALDEANRLMVQPGAMIKESEQLFPFRNASRSVINNLGTDDIALMHDVANPQVMTLLEGGITPLGAALTKYIDAPDVDRSVGYLVLGELQEAKSDAFAFNAAMCLWTIDTRFMPASLKAAEIAQDKRAFLAMARERATAAMTDGETLKQNVLDQKVAWETELAATTVKRIAAEEALATTNAKIDSLNEEAAKLMHKSRLEVRAEPAKAFLDQALELKSQAQALKEQRDGISGGPEVALALAAQIRRLQEKETQLAASIKVAEQQVVEADALLEGRVLDQRQASVKAEVLEGELAAARGHLVDSLTGLTEMAESFDANQAEARDACKNALASYAQGAKLSGQRNLRGAEAERLAALGSLQIEELIFAAKLGVLRGEIDNAALADDPAISVLLARLDAVAIDPQVVRDSAEQYLAQAILIYNELIDRAKGDAEAYYQLEQAAVYMQRYILTNDTTYRDQAESRVSSVEGLRDPKFTTVIARLKMEVIPLDAVGTGVVVTPPRVVDTTPTEPDEPIKTVSPETDAIRESYAAFIAAITSGEAEDFLAAVVFTPGDEATETLLYGALDMTYSMIQFEEAMVAKFGPDSLDALNVAMRESGMSMEFGLSALSDDIQVDGDSAVAVARDGDDIPFLKVDGDWKVDALTLLQLPPVDSVEQAEDIVAQMGMMTGMMTDAADLVESSDTVDDVAAGMVEMRGGQ